MGDARVPPPSGAPRTCDYREGSDSRRAPRHDVSRAGTGVGLSLPRTGRQGLGDERKCEYSSVLFACLFVAVTLEASTLAPQTWRQWQTVLSLDQTTRSSWPAGAPARTHPTFIGTHPSKPLRTGHCIASLSAQRTPTARTHLGRVRFHSFMLPHVQGRPGRTWRFVVIAVVL